MEKIIFIIFLSIQCLFGQNGHNTYEFKMGAYTYKAIDESPIVTNKPKPISIKISPYEITTSQYDEMGNEHIKTEMVEHISVAEILDSVSVESCIKKLAAKIEIYWNQHKAKVAGVFVTVHRPQGEPYFKGINSDVITSDREIVNYIKSSPENTYVVIQRVEFFPEHGNRDTDYIMDGFAFKIIK